MGDTPRGARCGFLSLLSLFCFPLALVAPGCWGGAGHALPPLTLPALPHLCVGRLTSYTWSVWSRHLWSPFYSHRTPSPPPPHSIRRSAVAARPAARGPAPVAALGANEIASVAGIASEIASVAGVMFAITLVVSHWRERAGLEAEKRATPRLERGEERKNKNQRPSHHFPKHKTGPVRRLRPAARGGLRRGERGVSWICVCLRVCGRRTPAEETRRRDRVKEKKCNFGKSLLGPCPRPASYFSVYRTFGSQPDQRRPPTHTVCPLRQPRRRRWRPQGGVGPPSSSPLRLVVPATQSRLSALALPPGERSRVTRARGGPAPAPGRGHAAPRGGGGSSSLIQAPAKKPMTTTPSRPPHPQPAVRAALSSSSRAWPPTRPNRLS